MVYKKSIFLISLCLLSCQALISSDNERRRIRPLTHITYNTHTKQPSHQAMRDTAAPQSNMQCIENSCCCIYCASIATITCCCLARLTWQEWMTYRTLRNEGQSISNALKKSTRW